MAMSRKRITREDSRDQTTQRLLDAAQKLIAKKGLNAASVEDIAEAAGYTRGAFYSNFNSKGDLFIELLRRDHAETHAELAPCAAMRCRSTSSSNAAATSTQALSR